MDMDRKVGKLKDFVEIFSVGVGCYSYKYTPINRSTPSTIVATLFTTPIPFPHIGAAFSLQGTFYYCILLFA